MDWAQLFQFIFWTRARQRFQKAASSADRYYDLRSCLRSNRKLRKDTSRSESLSQAYIRTSMYPYQDLEQPCVATYLRTQAQFKDKAKWGKPKTKHSWPSEKVKQNEGLKKSLKWKNINHIHYVVTESCLGRFPGFSVRCWRNRTGQTRRSFEADFPPLLESFEYLWIINERSMKAKNERKKERKKDPSFPTPS